MKKEKEFVVCYSLRGSVTIKAANEEEAKEMLLNSDFTETSELLESVQFNIGEVGNDAIGIDDVYEADKL